MFSATHSHEQQQQRQQQREGQHSLPGGSSSEQQPLLHGHAVSRRSSTSSSSSSSCTISGRYTSDPLAASPQSHPSGDTIVAVGDSAQLTQAVPEKLTQHYAWTRERFSLKWWLEWTAIIFVFSITGSSSMMLVRPLMKALGLVGSIKEGPWLYRIAYIILTLPVYSLVLLFIATLFGRRPYFEHLLQKMWGRILPRRLQCWSSST